MSRGRGHLEALTGMLQVGQNKGTECNEMRNFFVECHRSDKSQTQYGTNSIDELWQPLTPFYRKVFFL